MNTQNTRTRTMRRTIRRILPAAVILLLIAVLAFPAAAAELAAEAPSGSYQNGDVITIPIYLKNDMNFVGFSAKVNNNIKGVTVTISDAQPITDAQYQINSNGGSSEQLINAAFFSAPLVNTGISDENIHLFDINVVINDASVTNVPIEVTLRELYAVDGSGNLESIDVEKVKQINIKNIRLTDNAQGSVVSQGKPDPTPEQQVFIPTQSTPAGNTPKQTSAPQTAPQSSEVTQKGADSSASTPGFGAAAVIFGLLGTALLVRKRS